MRNIKEIIGDQPIVSILTYTHKDIFYKPVFENNLFVVRDQFQLQVNYRYGLLSTVSIHIEEWYKLPHKIGKLKTFYYEGYYYTIYRIYDIQPFAIKWLHGYPAS